MTLLYDHLLTVNTKWLPDDVPPVLPLVIYNGAAEWKAKRSVVETMRLEAGSILEDYQPNLRYYLLDIGRLDEDELSESEEPTSMFFEMEQAHTLEDMEGLLGKLKRVLDREPELKALFFLWFEHVMARREAFELSEEQWRELEGEPEGVTMLREKMAVWREELRQQGLEEGREEGRERARAGRW